MNYPPTKVPPWAHQIECWKLAENKNHYYIAHDMGCVDGAAIVTATVVKSHRIGQKNMTVAELYKLFKTSNMPIKINCLHIEAQKIFTQPTKGSWLLPNYVLNVLKKGIRSVVRITTKQGRSLILTRDHEVATADATHPVWIEAAKLAPGMQVLAAPAGAEKAVLDTIVSVKRHLKIAVYDVVMSAPHHNFVANEIVVHNCGKTKGAIDFANGWNVRSMLVICPAKVIPNWPKQIEMNSAAKYAVLALTSGTGRQKADAVKHHMDHCAQSNLRPAIITNYESFWRHPLGCQMSEKNRFRISKPGILYKYQWDLLVFDEAHRLKQPSGKASWAAAALAKCAAHRLALSGTPLPHSPLDLYAQMRAIDPSIFGTNFGAFKAEYAVMGGFENRQVLSWKNLDQLQKKFFSMAHYVSADDALDLPDTMDITVECELGPKARKIYHELDKEFISAVDAGIITVSNALDKLLRLQQITTGHVQFEDGCEAFVDNNKIETLLEIVEDIKADEPVVIFYLFTQEGRRIRAGLEKMGRTVAEISGRMDDQAAFESGAANTALVQIQSGCEGLDNLKRARYCIYGCIGFSNGRYRQSRRRVWRPGQTRKVVYYHVVTKATVDVKIMRSLNSKEEIVNSILNDIRNSSGKTVAPANPFADMRTFAKASS